MSNNTLLAFIAEKYLLGNVFSNMRAIMIRRRRIHLLLQKKNRSVPRSLFRKKTCQVVTNNVSITQYLHLDKFYDLTWTRITELQIRSPPC